MKKHDQFLLAADAETEMNASARLLLDEQIDYLTDNYEFWCGGCSCGHHQFYEV
jgi:hypothetical protein